MTASKPKVNTNQRYVGSYMETVTVTRDPGLAIGTFLVTNSLGLENRKKEKIRELYIANQSYSRFFPPNF